METTQRDSPKTDIIEYDIEKQSRDEVECVRAWKTLPKIEGTYTRDTLGVWRLVIL
jgi:hypothetical protein